MNVFLEVAGNVKRRRVRKAFNQYLTFREKELLKSTKSLGLCRITVFPIESKLAEMKFGFPCTRELLWLCFFLNAASAFCIIENY